MIRSRRRGALLGLAIGDALGAAVEFSSPGTFTPVTGYRGGGPHGLGPGEWTDDTSMALALAHSIGVVGWDLNDQAERYVAWWRRGEYSVNGVCFDIGNTTRWGLAEYLQTKDARTSGGTSHRSSGNGSIMRLAPVAIAFGHWLHSDLAGLALRAEESSLPTHGSDACRSACRYLAVVLAGLMHGLERDIVLAPDWPMLDVLRRIRPLHPEIDEVACGSFREREPPDVEGSGYVVRSLEAALWAVHRANSFREAVLMAVNLGDDSDTTGAVCGQLAGACWGEDNIPPEWLSGLARHDLLEAALSRLMSGG